MWCKSLVAAWKRGRDMKVAVLQAINELSVSEVPEPKCGSGDILVRVEACMVCGTDLKIYKVGHGRLSLPHVLGHEISGTVVQAGDRVVDFKVGDRIVVAPAGVGCGKCYYCKAELDNVCDNRRFMGFEWNGGFAGLNVAT